MDSSHSEVKDFFLKLRNGRKKAVALIHLIDDVINCKTGRLWVLRMSLEKSLFCSVLTCFDIYFSEISAFILIKWRCKTFKCQQQHIFLKKQHPSYMNYRHKTLHYDQTYWNHFILKNENILIYLFGWTDLKSSRIESQIKSLPTLHRLAAAFKFRPDIFFKKYFLFPFYWAEKETCCISFYWQQLVSRCFKCRTFGSFYFIWRRRDIKLRILLGGTWSCKEFEGSLPKPRETALAAPFSTTSATCFISQTGSLSSSSQANWRVNSLRVAYKSAWYLVNREDDRYFHIFNNIFNNNM